MDQSTIFFNGIIPLFSAFLGGFISLWVFKKGIVEQQKSEKRKQAEDNYEIEEFFKLNILSLLKFINFQIDEIAKLSRKTKDWEARNMTLPIMPELKLTEIRNLDFKSLFQILVLNRKGDFNNKASDFINIKNCFHNVEAFITSHEQQNMNAHDILNRESAIWNQSQKNLIQLSNKYLNECTSESDELIPILQSSLVVKQREIINSGYSNNLDIMFEEIITPLIVKIPNLKNRQDPRIQPILENLIQIKNAYGSIKNYRYQRRKGILESGRRLLETKRLLQKSLESIEKRKKIK